MTPYEVVFLSVQMDWLFFVNRLFDIVFILDILVNTRLAYFNKSERVWVTEPDKVCTQSSRLLLTDCMLQMKGTAPLFVGMVLRGCNLYISF